MEAIRVNPKDYLRNLNRIVNGTDDMQSLSVDNMAAMFTATAEQIKQAELETMRDYEVSTFGKLIDKMFLKYGLEK